LPRQQDECPEADWRGENVLNEEDSRNLAVTFGRLRDPYGRAVKPFLLLFPCPGNWLGLFENAGIRNQTNKSEETGLRQSHRRGSVKPIIHPLPGLYMLRKADHMSIDQEVCVNEDHLKFSFLSLRIRSKAQKHLFPG